MQAPFFTEGQKMRSSRHYSCGYTLIELLVAIVIAGIVITLGFTVYGNMVKGFSRQSAAAADLSSTIIVKKNIDRVCRRLAVLKRFSENEISGTSAENDSSITLQVKEKKLLSGNSTIVRGLESFAFSLEENRKDLTDNRVVLLWEGKLENGNWIGGAMAVRKE